jgi:hypothetical protein
VAAIPHGATPQNDTAVADLDVRDFQFFEHQLWDTWKKSANCSSAGDSESEE